jgi:DNA-binding MarR family transcriptional regulator
MVKFLAMNESMAKFSGPQATAGELRAIAKAIRRIIHAMDLRSRRIAATTGLTVPQIVVLQGAAELGAVTTGALAQWADLAQPTVTAILDNLEARGLVERWRSPTDRRVVHSRLTAEGRRVLDAAPTMLDERFRVGFAALPAARRAALVAAVTELAALVEPGGAPPR